MPFTPFHFGPALFFGLLLFGYLSFPAFLVANVIVDIEPFLVLFFGHEHYPLHGFFHSLLGGAIIAILVAVWIFFLQKWLNNILAAFRVQQTSSFTQILFASLLGVYFHILLDSFLYSEINIFYPLLGNPLFNVVGFGVVYGFCSVSFIFGLIIYVYRLIVSIRKEH